MNCVTVHTLHQHDGVRCDLTAEALLTKHGLDFRLTGMNPAKVVKGLLA